MRSNQIKMQGQPTIAKKNKELGRDHAAESDSWMTDKSRSVDDEE